MQVTYVTWASAAAVESGENTSDYVSLAPCVTMQESEPELSGEALWPVPCA